MNDPRGSYWRRWDLHVHTPYSELNNGFGDDFDTYAKELLTRAKDNDIACIGITDYFLIDGYKALRKIVDEDTKLEALLDPSCATHAKKVLYLPNIEFRSSTIVRYRDAGGRLTIAGSTFTSSSLIQCHLKQLKRTSCASSSFRPMEHPLHLM